MRDFIANINLGDSWWYENGYEVEVTSIKKVSGVTMIGATSKDDVVSHDDIDTFRRCYKPMGVVEPAFNESLGVVVSDIKYYRVSLIDDVTTRESRLYIAALDNPIKTIKFVDGMRVFWSAQISYEHYVEHQIRKRGKA